jgi:hypothetical protein
MRTPIALTIAVVSACDGASSGGLSIAGGSLVSLSEKETAQLTVSGAESVTVTSADPVPDWVHVDHSQITLTPDCSVVPGTDGPPKLFELEVSDGHSSIPLLVQVRPSGVGECAPSMRACVTSDPCVQNTPVTCTPDKAISGPIDVTDSSSTQSLFLTVVNPDAGDTVLALPTTDAPLTLHPTSSKAKTTYCTDLPARAIVGAFTISYVLGRMPDNDTPIISTGAFRLKWNIGPGRKAGLELAMCASKDQPCMIKRGANNNWCIETNPVRDDPTIGFRAWVAPGAVSPGPNGQSIVVQLVSQDGPVLVSPDRKATTVDLTYSIDQINAPPVVTADVGTGTPPYTFVLLDPQKAPPQNQLATTTVQVAQSCP